MPSGFPKKPWDIILLHVNIHLIFSLFNNPAFAKKKLDREYKIQAIRSYRHYFTHVHSVCYLKIEVGLCFFAPVKSINNKSCIYIAFFKPINYNSKQFSRWLTKQKQDGNGEKMLLLDFSYVACSRPAVIPPLWVQCHYYSQEWWPKLLKCDPDQTLASRQYISSEFNIRPNQTHAWAGPHKLCCGCEHHVWLHNNK